jgi:hypothetical protein
MMRGTTIRRRKGDHMIRREFIALAGGAAVAWPLAARAQQKAVPVIGILNSFSTLPNLDELGRGPIPQGLSETGYVEGQNVAIERRWAEGHYDRLPALAGDLVSRKVDLIITFGGTPPALAAKNATSTIPIVFAGVGDPVRIGLVVGQCRGWVEPGCSIVVTPTAGIGASRPLLPVPAKVPLLNRQQPLSLHRRNRSSCPIPAVRNSRGDRLSWLEMRHSRFARPRCGHALKAVVHCPKPGHPTRRPFQRRRW